MLEKDLESFVGCYEMPLRHGMTFGELATMANAEQRWGTELHVVKMNNWLRSDWLDASLLISFNPSPHMRSLNAELLYPGMANVGSSYRIIRSAAGPTRHSSRSGVG